MKASILTAFAAHRELLQVEQLCCPLFRAVWQKLGTKRALWDQVRSHFRHFCCDSMQRIYEAILYDLTKNLPLPTVDSS